MLIIQSTHPVHKPHLHPYITQSHCFLNNDCTVIEALTSWSYYVLEISLWFSTIIEQITKIIVMYPLHNYIVIQGVSE